MKRVAALRYRDLVMVIVRGDVPMIRQGLPMRLDRTGNDEETKTAACLSVIHRSSHR